jgi:hypothetical protein
MVPKWKFGGQQEGLDVIIVNQSCILSQEQGKRPTFKKQLQRDYGIIRLGNWFRSVSDVVEWRLN